MLSFIEVKRSCFCLESTSSCFAYPTAFCMQVIYARCRWNILCVKMRKEVEVLDMGVEMCFKEQSTFLFWPGYGSRVDAKTAKKYAYYVSCFFISHRCSGKIVGIISRWLKFEAKNRVRKPTASSNAQLSCPIWGNIWETGRKHHVGSPIRWCLFFKHESGSCPIIIPNMK